MPLEVTSVSVQGNQLRVTIAEGLAGLAPLGAFTAEEFQQATRGVTGHPATAWAHLAAQLPESLAGPLNIALLDIVGKFSRAPVYQILGGPTRNKVRVMARAGNLDAVQALWDRGHRAFAVDAGDPKTIAARLRAIRTRLPDADFVLDGGGKLSTGQASTVAAELEPFHLLWFNEPCASYNLAAVRKISAETVTPLGFGGSIEVQEFLKEDAIDVVRPSVRMHGLNGCRKIAALAEVYYVAIAPERTSTALETLAALHLAASIPNFFIQEIPADSALPVRDGYVELPVKPGLGVDA